MSSAGRKCMMDQAIWLEGQWPSWRAAEAINQTKPQDDAGIKYVDMGASFSKKAEALYWAELSKANPAFIKKIRPLLSK